jgi:hypothetical protein
VAVEQAADAGARATGGQAGAAAQRAAGAGRHPMAGYLGHYILLVGYDPGTRRFLVHDPDRPCGPTELDAALLEEGRRAAGTDEDLLVVAL